MATVIFWDVDTQYDFLRRDGKLYVPDAVSIIPVLKNLTEYAHQHGIRIVATAERHPTQHHEFSSKPDYKATFPPHCIEGTPGQEKISETSLRSPLLVPPEPIDSSALEDQLRQHDGDVLIEKNEFDVFSNANVDTILRVLDPDDVVIYGVALDVCNRYAIEGLLQHRPHTRIFAVQDAMRAAQPRMTEHYLRAWGDEGVRIVTSADILEDDLVAALRGVS